MLSLNCVDLPFDRFSSFLTTIQIEDISVLGYRTCGATQFGTTLVTDVEYHYLQIGKWSSVSIRTLVVFCCT